MLHRRVISALFGIPILLLAVWYGSWAHFFLTVAIMVLALFELNRIFSRMDLKPSLVFMLAGLLLLAAFAYRGGIGLLGAAIMPVVALLLLSGIIRYPAVTTLDMAAGLAGTLYLGLFIYFYLVRTMEGGLVWVLILLVSTWAGDSAAYFTGKKFGRKRLAPRLSPGKTVEGAIGGLAGSVLGAALIYYFYPLKPFVMFALLGLLVGISGLLGDLFESSLKRTAGLKDTGSIIPGHGGVLDRFDSLIFASPVAYYFVYIFLTG